MNTKTQFIQQAKQLAREEAKKTFDSVTEQVASGVIPSISATEAAQPVDEVQGANVEEIKRQEQAKMAQLKARLEQEIAIARQQREQQAQQYSQSIEQQLQAGQHQDGEQKAPIEVPHSVQKGPRGPVGPQSKKGTKEMGKMKG